ncbi:sensor histidine kinase [Frateuria soli]|uniref:sensor histidine kinase n=1 Tax=Frateuria soli TaxID=1542730 RepID=UPI001E4AF4B6|nr:HWE histidine kinase domain-containing protein [Frateuria soli]UGB36849.1 GAF domain-containing protein [Frateuria soli]
MYPSPAEQAGNAEVFITSALHARVPRKVDYRHEKAALQDLAARMAGCPEELLPRLVDLALETTGAVTGGLSLYDEASSPGGFRWHCLRGLLEPFEGGFAPRDYSPCGITLDQRAPVLVQNPERIYDWLVEVGMSLPEVLLVPLYVGSELPLGTLWVVAESNGHFDREHARVLTEFASFVDIALRMVRSEQHLRQALDEQELLTREMNHRIQNLFAMTHSLVRMSARHAGSASELADTLLGRLGALQRAHGRVRSGFASSQVAPGGSDLADLIRDIMEPHEGQPGPTRCSLTGAPLLCGPRSATALALIFHELATNAAKYGALSTEMGRVAIDWREEGGSLHLRWTEEGGPRVECSPGRSGFGATLVSNSVTRQLGGTLRQDWRPDGLVLQMELPIAALSQ